MNLPLAPGVRRRRLAQVEVQALETVLTPHEMMARPEEAEADGNPLLARLLRASPTLAFLAAQARLEPFERRILSEGATLYAGRQSPAGRSLMVAFCGKADRPMLPTPMFLQHICAASWDVLLLKDALRTHYRQGVSGFASSFVRLVPRAASLAAGYVRCVALGTSMGGLPAVRFALLAGIERGISIGGRPPNDVLRLRERRGPAEAFDPLCACLPLRPRDLLFSFSADCAPDREAAEAYAGLTGGRVVAVEGQHAHGLLHRLHLTGGLRDFLDGVLHRPLQGR